MKKSLLALAVAASLPAVAQAQSSVTLYGLLDAGVQYANSAANGGRGAVTTVVDGGSTQSRLGFRGVEPLGNTGMSAIFTIETRLNIDNATTGGANYTPWAGSASTNTQFWNGLAFVGLRQGTTELTIGRQYTPGFYAWIANDFTGNRHYSNWATFGGATSTGIATGGTNPSYGAVRADNSVMLSTTLGGLNVRAMVAPGEGISRAAGAASGDLYALMGTFNVTKAASVSAFYHQTDAAAAKTQDTAYGVAGKLDLGNMGVTLGYSTQDLQDGTNFNTLISSSYVRFGANRVLLNASRVKVDNIGAVADTTQTNLALTLQRTLSNRTYAYGTIGRVSGSNVASTGTQTQGVIGVLHNF